MPVAFGPSVTPTPPAPRPTPLAATATITGQVGVRMQSANATFVAHKYSLEYISAMLLRYELLLAVAA